MERKLYPSLVSPIALCLKSDIVYLQYLCIKRGNVLFALPLHSHTHTQVVHYIVYHITLCRAVKFACSITDSARISTA